MTTSEYYERVREELLERFSVEPRRLLDVGCGAGATAAAARRRWPAVETIGIELMPDAAATARGRLDRVIEGSVESIDLRAAGIEHVDAVLLADVLEHLRDPWSFLHDLREVLAPSALVVASIPNAANLWLIEELASGRFDYADDGLLDRTHLRFFTRRTIERAFDEAGYRIDAIDRITDGRVDDLTTHRLAGIFLPRPLLGTIRGQRVSVHGASGAEYEDLRTIQFIVSARPAR